ncbi:MAG: type II toxin-antitoxin system VapC family toxin [Bacteriovorax sp.]|nr:type II toxin-antitoxin system VapC family toxin [Bacteriovorax sp.]
MIYLLDTNTLIALFHRREPTNTYLRTKKPENLFLSGVTIGEIFYGIEKSSFESIAKNRVAREAIMTQFQHVYTDQSISEEYGKIKAELSASKSYSPNNENDIWIAAHARAKSYILVTENLKDFQSIQGLSIECWADNPIKVIQT